MQAFGDAEWQGPRHGPPPMLTPPAENQVQTRTRGNSADPWMGAETESNPSNCGNTKSTLLLEKDDKRAETSSDKGEVKENDQRPSNENPADEQTNTDPVEQGRGVQTGDDTRDDLSTASTVVEVTDLRE